jgi:hypothetical protein
MAADVSRRERNVIGDDFAVRHPPNESKSSTRQEQSDVRKTHFSFVRDTPAVRQVDGARVRSAVLGGAMAAAVAAGALTTVVPASAQTYSGVCPTAAATAVPSVTNDTAISDCVALDCASGSGPSRPTRWRRTFMDERVPNATEPIGPELTAGGFYTGTYTTEQSCRTQIDAGSSGWRGLGNGDGSARSPDTL